MAGGTSMVADSSLTRKVKGTPKRGPAERVDTPSAYERSSMDVARMGLCLANTLAGRMKGWARTSNSVGAAVRKRPRTSAAVVLWDRCRCDCSTILQSGSFVAHGLAGSDVAHVAYSTLNPVST